MKKLFLFLLAVMPTIVFSQELNLDDLDEPQVPVVTVSQAPAQEPTAPVAEPQTPTHSVNKVTVGDQSIMIYNCTWATLGPQTRAEINEMAKKSPFGTTVVAADIATVRSVTTITGVPSRSGRTMTEYVIVYWDQNGEEHGILTYDNPLASPECPECYIKCVATSPGFHQGDDEDIPNQPTTGENHRIPR